MVKNCMRTLNWVVALWFVSFSASISASEWDEAKQVVEESTQAMIVLLEEGRAVAELESKALGEVVELDAAALQKGMEEVLGDVIDFDSIAKGVMAKFFRQASVKQKESFRIAFKESLLATYSSAVVAFRINDFDIQPNPNEKAKPGRQKVWVKIYANGAAYDLIYTMRKRTNGWMVTNVTLDGINLGLAFRQQFSSAMAKNKGKMDDVIAFWNERS